MGRSGCGKSTDRPACAAPDGPDGRLGTLQGRGDRRPRQERPAPAAPPHADHLPGPLCLPEPPHDGRRDFGRADGGARAAHRGRAREPRARASRCRRPAARAGAALSAPVLGRPTPADRHRPRARRQSRPDRVRRAGLRPRCLDPGADRQPAAEPAAPLRPLLSVHRPRPRRGEAHQRPRGGDVSRQAGRDRLQARPLRAAAASLYASAAGGDPAARSPRAQDAHAAAGRRAEPLRAAAGLPLQHALSLRPAALPRGGAGAARGRPQSRASCRLPLLRDAARPAIAAEAGAVPGKFAERLAAFEAAKQARIAI